LPPIGKGGKPVSSSSSLSVSLVNALLIDVF
jgi:hypothetical protein